MKVRKPKTTYSCAPCKRHKIKCDHSVPCSNCVKNHREQDCLKSPAKTLSQFKELIKPNASFGRINKDTQTKKNSVSSVSSVESIISSSLNTSPVSAVGSSSQIISQHQLLSAPSHQNEHQHQKSTDINYNDLVCVLERRLANKSTTLDEALHRNFILTQQNDDLMRQLNFHLHFNQNKVALVDLYNGQTFEQITNFKRSMVELLPPREIIVILKDYFILNIHQDADCHVLNVVQFNMSFDAFWIKLYQEQNFLEIDLYWLALLFTIMATSLTLTSRSFIDSNPTLLSFSLRSQSWFNCSRQILTFMRSIDSLPNLVSLQIFLIGAKLISMNCQWMLLDQLLSQAVNEAYQLNLHNLKSDECLNIVEFEMRKRIWWLLVNIDTQRALLRRTPPLTMSFTSKTPQILNLNDHELHLDISKSFNQFTDVIVLIIKTEINKIMNEFEIKAQMTTSPELLLLIFAVDEKLCRLYQSMRFELSQSFSRSTLFQITALESFFTYNRFKIYQALLGIGLPTVEKICLKLASSVFTPYKYLKSITPSHPIHQDPFFLALLTIGTQSCIIQVIYLLSQNDNSLTMEINREILTDIDSYIRDLTNFDISRNAFQRLPYITDSLCVLNSLRNYAYSTLSFLTSKNTSQLKMKVDSLIINETRHEVWSPTTTYDRPPAYLEEQSIKQFKELLFMKPNALIVNEKALQEIKSRLPKELKDADYFESSISSYI